MPGLQHGTGHAADAKIGQHEDFAISPDCSFPLQYNRCLNSRLDWRNSGLLAFEPACRVPTLFRRDAVQISLAPQK